MESLLQERTALDIIFKLRSERPSWNRKDKKKGREKLSNQMFALKSHVDLQIIPLFIQEIVED